MKGIEDGLMRGNHWLEPLMPSEGRYPPSILEAAEQLPFLAGRISSILPVETTSRLGALLQITNTYYTNLIEGQHTEPAQLARDVKRKSKKELKELSIGHVHAQQAFEKLIDISRPKADWKIMFSPQLVARVHERLFTDASAAERTLIDGTELIPGQVRAECGRSVEVGGHLAPAPHAVASMLARMHTGYGALRDQRTRIIGSMAFHHRLAFVHPFADGNGRVVRMLTHMQLHYLGLSAPLWSLARGLARRQADYYRYLSVADRGRQGDLDGRGQFSEKGLCQFIEFMLDTCLDQMKYMEAVLELKQLKEKVSIAFAVSPEIRAAGIKPDCAKAIHILLSQGEVGRGNFKLFTGLGDRLATEQLAKMVMLGLVEAPSPKSRQLYPGLPIWFADLIFPELHRRFRPL